MSAASAVAKKLGAVRIHWINGPPVGRVGMARPRAGEWLIDEIDGWVAVALLMSSHSLKTARSESSDSHERQTSRATRAYI